MARIPELGSRREEEGRKEHDARIGQHAHLDHAARAETPCETTVSDGAGKRHELRHEQRQDQLGGVDAEARAVGGAHGDHGVHAVDVEEVREHEVEQRLVCGNPLHGGPEARQGVVHGTARRLGRLVVALAVAAQQRDRKGKPPQAGDHEGHPGGEDGGDADGRAAQDEGQADDEGDGGAHVAPRVPLEETSSMRSSVVTSTSMAS